MGRVDHAAAGRGLVGMLLTHTPGGRSRLPFFVPSLLSAVFCPLNPFSFSDGLCGRFQE